MRLIALAAILTIIAVTPAEAAPLSQAVAWMVTKLGVSVAFAEFVVQMAVSISLSALGSVLQRKDRRRQSVGIKTPYTMTGETNPESLIVGTYATGGQLVYPPLTHGGNSGKEYKTYVIALSCRPGCQLQRIALGGEWAQVTSTVHPDYGNELGGKHAGYAWVKFYDGSQTYADPMLLSKYGSHQDYPWSTDMIGAGLGYAIVTLRFNADLFSGADQRMRFELLGIPLYDPRKDDTAGGAGPHRWDDPSSWEASSNPIVMIYNILRGIDVGGGEIWGGRATATSLPYPIWAAAADTCDEAVPDGSGGTMPRYRAGLEISLDQSPADVIEDLLDACAGNICLSAGRWLVRAGPPALPTSTIVDDDIVVTAARTLETARSMDQSHNAVTATYVDPDAVYQSKVARELVSPSAISADGGRKLVASVDLPAVTDARQVARLQREWLNDDRRWRTHDIPVPPRLAALEPFDVITWTSSRNDYLARAFEITGVALDLRLLTQRITLREVNQQDWI